MHGYGMRPLEIIHSQTKSFLYIKTLLNILSHLKRNNLGIGGNILVYNTTISFIFFFQFKIIIDIPVQAHMDDTALLNTIPRNFIVDGVTVRFTDGTHRGPSGMGGNRKVFMGKRNQSLQNLVVFNLLAYKTNIISQTPHFCGDFIRQGKGNTSLVIFIRCLIDVYTRVNKNVLSHSLF